MPVTAIGPTAFYFGISLTSVTIPNSVTSIGDDAFGFCTSLSAISVSPANASYASLDGVLFNKTRTTLIQCPGGKAGGYTIPSSVTSLGDFTFGYCASLSSITIPDSVTSLGDFVFGYCTGLSGITIPNSVTSIGIGAFAGCTSLSAITIPNGVTSIRDRAFDGCTSLSSVTIPNGSASIGDYAFYDCTSLSSISIPDRVTSIGVYAFNYCTNLSAISVEALNIFYSSVDGVLFNKSQTTLIEFPGGKAGGYAIPNSVTTLGIAAFAGCASLSSITIPNSVLSIRDKAFYDCTSLKSVYFGGKAPSVGLLVFSDDNTATIYYLPQTTGWSSTFSGRPAVLWNPQAPTTDPNFGVRADQFGFTITGTAGLVIVIEATPSLTDPVWTPVGTNTLARGSSLFNDPQWVSYPTRIYRFRSP